MRMRKPPVWRMPAMQGLMILACVGISGALSGAVAAFSALLGGLICMIPGLYFSLAMFRYQGARSARLILQTTYKAETIKMVMTAAGFAAAFILVKPLSAGHLFAAFIAVQAVHWSAPWILQPRSQ
ncbi:ATP synthase subunit I [Allohahella marinimesophila]|uniref:ATP synthase subunit I n=1 Tax=Allohahella marinimesophila TaxID=1054972 RepID=UPI003CD0B936